MYTKRNSTTNHEKRNAVVIHNYIPYEALMIKDTKRIIDINQRTRFTHIRSYQQTTKRDIAINQETRLKYILTYMHTRRDTAIIGGETRHSHERGNQWTYTQKQKRIRTYIHNYES